MKDLRSSDGPEPLEGAYHLVYVIAVYRTEVAQSESLEQVAAGRGHQTLLGLAHQFLDHLACLAGSESVPKFVPEAVIGRVCGDL